MKPRPLPKDAKLHSKNAKKVFEGVRFDVYQWEQERFDKTTSTYEIVKRADSVIVIPIIDNEIILVKEKQPHWKKAVFNLVAGMVNPDEDLEVAAQRELEEETGFIFEHFYLVHIESFSPAVEWFGYTYLAYGYTGKKKKDLDSGEQNKVLRVPFEKFMKMVKNFDLFYRPRFIEDMIVQGKEKELKNLIKNPEKCIKNFKIK